MATASAGATPLATPLATPSRAQPAVAAAQPLPLSVIVGRIDIDPRNEEEDPFAYEILDEDDEAGAGGAATGLLESARAVRKVVRDQRAREAVRAIRAAEKEGEEAAKSSCQK